MITALGTKDIDAAFEIKPFVTLAAGQGVGQMVINVGDIAAGFPAPL